MNKSLTEFLQREQVFRTAGSTVPYINQQVSPFQPTGIMDRAIAGVQGLLRRIVPGPIRKITPGLPAERDLYASDRDYNISKEYDRLMGLGMSEEEARNTIKKLDSDMFGYVPGMLLTPEVIPGQYRKEYEKTVEEEMNMLAMLGTPTMGALKFIGISKGAATKLISKFGDKAAIKIMEKGPVFVKNALKEGGEEVVKRAGIRIPDYFGRKITSEVIKDVKKTIPVISKAVKGEGLKDLPAMKEGQRVTKYVAELIRDEKLNPNQTPVLRNLAKKYNLVDEKGRVYADELANQLDQMMSESGRSLNIASQWGQQLKKELSKMGVKTIAPPPTFWDKINNTQRGIINLWRASLVSQLRTGVRNMGMFGYRYTMNVMDDAMQGAYLAATGKQPVKQAFGPMIEDVLAIGRVLKPKGRQVVLNALDASPALKTKAWQYTASDIMTGNRVTNALATFTRLQSYATRTININAKIGAWARASGKNFYDIKPTDVPTKVLRDAIDTALDMDLMKQAQGKVAKDVLRLFHDVPILNAITYPFPRYMSNAIRNIYEFSPLGMTKFFSKEALTKLAGGDRAALSAMNKAILGTVGYITAHRIRNSEYAGEKWHELKVKDKTYDMRYWGPWISTYMFIAEAIRTNGEGFGPRDWMEGALGVNKMAGTTLFIASAIGGQEDWQGFKKAFQSWSGEFIGGFGNPAMTVKDFFSMFDDEERYLRYTKEDPWLGPFKARVPGLSQTLPKQPTMTREGTYEIERFDPVLKQVTAIPRKEKNLLEAEIDRLGIQLWQLKPKTGDAWLDRKLIEGTGTYMQSVNDLMEQKPNYGELEDGEREDLIRLAISEAKKLAKQQFFIEYENEVVDHYLDNIRPMTTEERVKYLEDLKNKGLIPLNIQKKLLEEIELRGS